MASMLVPAYQEPDICVRRLAIFMHNDSDLNKTWFSIMESIQPFIKDMNVRPAFNNNVLLPAAKHVASFHEKPEMANVSYGTFSRLCTAHGVLVWLHANNNHLFDATHYRKLSEMGSFILEG